MEQEREGGEGGGRGKGCFVPQWAAIAAGAGFVVLLVVVAVLGAGAGHGEAPEAVVDEMGGVPAQINAPAASEKVKDIRLPRSIKADRYVVRLQPYLNTNHTIAGYVEMHFTVVIPTSNITLHMTDILTANHTIKLTSPTGAPTPSISSHLYDNKREWYVAGLSSELQKGEYVISMHFQGLLNDKLKGFYRSVYTDADGKVQRLATTQFQPTDARRAFPCLDEPALKARFDVSLARRTNMTAISNMPRLSTTPIPGHPDWVWDTFNTTVPMSTYLLAFVVSDFAHVNSTDDSTVLFRVWTRQQALGQSKYALKIGPPILAWFENYFDIPFPLPKQDMIAIPDFSAGAMENWGLITYRETAMLYDPLVSAARNKQRVAVVVSHELAHQWFGDLVTPSWWTDLWLNEGFASYLENLGVDAVEPTWKMEEQFVTNALHSVFGLDCLETSHPISIPVGHPDEINEIFDRISYNKGASIIRMMNHFLGEATLRKGLKNYLKHFEYDSAEQDDLWRFLTAQAHADGLPRTLSVKAIMDTWTLQMGYPVVDVSFRNGGATITQERFLLVKSNTTDDSSHDYKWWIPITYTSQDSPDFTNTKPSIWMSKEEQTKHIKNVPSNGWKIFNIQETGYYRVNYDIENWNRLVAQLKKDHTAIHVVNRAQLLDDALDLARSGRQSYSIALDIFSYLRSEKEFVPWKAALNNLGYIKNMLSHTPIYGAFKKYLLTQLVPLYQSVGFGDRLSDPHLDQLKRIETLRWTCNLGYAPCVGAASDMFKAWMKSPANFTISPNLKSIVLCTALAEGDWQEWQFAWEQYTLSNVATEKDTLLGALGCTKQPWILSKYLEMTYKAGSGIRKQDASRAFGGVAYNPAGRDLAWSYLRRNWKSITEYYGSGLFGVGRLIEAASAKFSNEMQLEELHQFRRLHAASLGSAKRTLDQSIERTSNNIAWTSGHYDVIKAWLHTNGFS